MKILETADLAAAEPLVATSPRTVLQPPPRIGNFLTLLTAVDAPAQALVPVAGATYIAPDLTGAMPLGAVRPLARAMGTSSP